MELDHGSCGRWHSCHSDCTAQGQHLHLLPMRVFAKLLVSCNVHWHFCTFISQQIQDKIWWDIMKQICIWIKEQIQERHTVTKGKLPNWQKGPMLYRPTWWIMCNPSVLVSLSGFGELPRIKMMIAMLFHPTQWVEELSPQPPLSTTSSILCTRVIHIPLQFHNGWVCHSVDVHGCSCKHIWGKLQCTQSTQKPCDQQIQTNN
jgi:hypothetical protein